MNLNLLKLTGTLNKHVLRKQRGIHFKNVLNVDGESPKVGT